MKVIISTGQGSLHLIQSAISLKKRGISIRLITGWIPGKFFNEKRINWLGKMAGIKHNLGKGLAKRKPAGLSEDELKSCGFSEFFIQAMFKLSSYKVLPYSKSAVLGWKAFGRQSKSYISNADIFHVRSGAGAGGAIAYARKKGMKILVDHSIAHPKEMEVQLNKANRKSSVPFSKYTKTDPTDIFWKLVLQDCINADLLLVNSEYVKWSFTQQGYPQEKIRVAHLGVNAEFNKRKDQYNISGKIRLAFTGGFINRKGASLIIETLEILRARNVAFSFDVVGSVTAEIRIPEWMKTSPDIRLHGHLPQIQMLPILLDCDMYIFPTYTEGSAQSVKEAMAIGMPVITTMQSGAPIKHQENGWIIPDDSSEELADAIERLAKDISLREKIGKEAANTIQSEHTWDKYAEKVSLVYQELLK